jgi:hypothetical protein
VLDVREPFFLRVRKEQSQLQGKGLSRQHIAIGLVAAIAAGLGVLRLHPRHAIAIKPCAALIMAIHFLRCAAENRGLHWSVRSAKRRETMAALHIFRNFQTPQRFNLLLR